MVGCSKLKDTEWISRQDPYVCLEYATTKFRSRTSMSSSLTSMVVLLLKKSPELSKFICCPESHSNVIKISHILSLLLLQAQKKS
ncbi:hypothetical protein AXF42_Ash018534 [Apostasia shenzhenica]|uniref:Uncharacterized protein n=1 Tax=Apostasia shenzhenica TaxID=1088818 RepID=A0A2I0APT1_9ASPA|nr:hypothetical protein AXF42_Ash018534 [Apostasia shenzhenica]